MLVREAVVSLFWLCGGVVSISLAVAVLGKVCSVIVRHYATPLLSEMTQAVSTLSNVVNGLKNSFEQSNAQTSIRIEAQELVNKHQDQILDAHGLQLSNLRERMAVQEASAE